MLKRCFDILVIVSLYAPYPYNSCMVLVVRGDNAIPAASPRVLSAGR